MTLGEKRKKRRLYDKEYDKECREAEKKKKERLKIYSKSYNEANKDRVRANRKAYNKSYNEANKERKADIQRAYRAKKKRIAQEEKADKERRAAYNRTYRESKKSKYTTIYCIPNYNGKGDNYVGITNNLIRRLSSHKHLGKLNTDKYIELDKVDDRKEAEVLESKYHSRGYHGATAYK